MKKKYSAFSLIELSIVILIIGVLIAGVTQASRLVRQSKLTTARTLTQSSAVNGIKGLVLWLEPTMDNSFSSAETSDTLPVTTWRDINPQVSLPNNFTSNDSSKTTYKYSGSTNALPAITFVAGNTGFSGTTYIDTPFSAYTVFIVARSISNTANTLFYNGVSGTNGFGVSLTTGGLTQLTYGNTSATVSGSTSIAANKGSASIISLTIAPNFANGSLVSTPDVYSYINGAVDMNGTKGSPNKTITTAIWVSPTTKMFLGNNAATGTSADFIGEMSEVIIFDSVLKTSDRQEVEKYLGKKYGIILNQ